MAASLESVKKGTPRQVDMVKEQATADKVPYLPTM